MKCTWICYWCEKEQTTEDFPAPMQKCTMCSIKNDECIALLREESRS